MKEMFKITFTDINGQRRTYMQTAFDTKECAESELRRIKEYKENHQGIGSFFNRDSSYIRHTSVLHGKNFRIKKINLKEYL